MDDDAIEKGRTGVSEICVWVGMSAVVKEGKIWVDDNGGTV